MTLHVRVPVLSENMYFTCRLHTVLLISTAKTHGTYQLHCTAQYIDNYNIDNYNIDVI